MTTSFVGCIILALTTLRTRRHKTNVATFRRFGDVLHLVLCPGARCGERQNFGFFLRDPNMPKHGSIQT